MKSSKAAEAEVRSWGYRHVFTWTDSANGNNEKPKRSTHTPPPRPFTNIHVKAHYAPHTHSGKTTHLILRGGLTMAYPDDATPRKETLGVGARWDVEANRKHEVWVGEEGCTYVIGE
ncbi:hypothetical protein B0A55_00507 [Friedmanniomyces simplex]|uniref:Cupin 2 conserved barrel domain-containing protein n=1 Tax=Friedmanniomyces simplex TaxID=329884 RepID=A0A4V5NKW0_9PEZI|nr:hypothetical protein B0A55_00507 [Friedmanniomyces simplex]